MRRLRAVAVPALLLVAAVAVAGIWLGSRDDSDRPPSTLPSLPPGEPRLLPLRGVAERVDAEELIGRAELVFVGTVRDVGGSEVVTPAGSAGEPFLLTRHRVRFEVSKVMRGEATDWIDVSLLDFPQAHFEFEVGEEYLVFARRTELGTTRVPAVIPDGYAQGVFTMVGGGLATNRLNGTLEISRLEERLR